MSLRPVASRAVSSPIEALTLASGLRVVVVRQPHLHRASATYVLRVGPRFEAPEQVGISHFLEHMLHRGTASHPSAHELAVAVEEHGATLDAATGVEHGSLAATFPTERALEVVRLLGEVVTVPAFTDIDTERGIVREELLEDRDERGRLVDPDGVLRAALFGDHPLGYPIVGTPKSLRSFDVPALRAHHARHYTSSSAVLALAGRLPPASKLVPTLERAFAKHPKGRALRGARFTRSNQPNRGPILAAVDTPASQVGIRVACTGPGRGARLEAATELLLRTIDDGTSTRLYERLCDRGGLCYEVSAGYEPYEGAGLVDVAAEAHEDAAITVVSEILAMLRELATSGPTAAEVAKAKARARWFAERAADQPEAAAEQAAMGVLAGEPMTALARVARYDALEADDLRRAAAALFRRERLAIALVGPVSRATRRKAQSLVDAHAP
jgi:predicted Zn-dependent peptidase